MREGGRGSGDVCTQARVKPAHPNPLRRPSTSILLHEHLASWKLGSFNNGDGNGNEKGEKAIGSKTTTLHVYHVFFLHFFAVTARLRSDNA